MAGEKSPCVREFAIAVDAGREAFELGLPEASDHASATSPLTGFLD